MVRPILVILELWRSVLIAEVHGHSFFALMQPAVLQAFGARLP